MKKFVATNSKIIIFSLIFSVIGFVGGMLLPERLVSYCDLSKFKFINSDLICEDKLIVDKKSYASLKVEINDFIDQQKREGKITDASIYFRDLKYGPTLGINEYENFSPASLLKLPLFLTYFNVKNENDPTLFEKEITLEVSEDNLGQTVQPKESAEYGKTYSIKQLLEYMIRYSDNRAYYALLGYLRRTYPERDLLKDTFVDLGIIDPKDFLDNTISVKSYGSIFVQLYHSSYFSKKETSNAVLSMLTKVDWNNGINAGVPGDIKVAHKFGERSNVKGNLSQLHDCGIVYYPKNPYLLCIMTRGNDIDTLTKVIADISKMFYEEFYSRKL